MGTEYKTKEHLLNLAEEAKAKLHFFRNGGVHLCFLKDLNNKLLNDGHSMEDAEAIRFLKARCKGIQGDTREEMNV